ncbi:hypothetical protein DW182_08065 [Bacteroides sp. AM16-24]|uniref:hypothetical protein n=1 Tax=Bacteroides sp. AM16-24 TaxID=2292002 RepID=UPI000E4B0ABE|nr:hypothetical protein [Bacteroides sp. AM16-24]RHI09235.1 hypothetical protein DW182_08065 [Bacteroides sp. AM16-24]
MAQALIGLRWNQSSRWMHSIGLTDIPNELLHSQTNPTGGGFVCPQRHSKFMFRAARNHLPRSKPRREGTSRWSILCTIITISD